MRNNQSRDLILIKAGREQKLEIYFMWGTGGTFVGGAAVARLQNEKGVVLELHGPQMGFHVSLGLAGMTIALR